LGLYFSTMVIVCGTLTGAMSTGYQAVKRTLQCKDALLKYRRA